MSISKNDYLNAIRYDKKSNNIAADKLRIKKENLLQIIEFEEIKAFQQKKHHRNLFLLGKIILIIFIILLIGFICTYLMARKRHKSLKREIDDLQIFLDKLQKHNLVLQSKYDEIIDQQESSHVIESNNNEQRSDTVLFNDHQLSEIITNVAEAFKYILAQIRKNTKDEKGLKQLDIAIKKTLTPSYFNHLRKFVDYAYDGLASDMAKSKILKEKDINIICMYLCQLPNVVLRIYTGYASSQNTIRYRNQIIKKYFGSKERFEQITHDIKLE